jgi:hypothetical protein
VSGVLELIVRRPDVVNHRAGIVEPRDGLGHSAAAGRVDDVRSCVRSDQRVQPGGQAAYPPTCLIGHHPVGQTHDLSDGLIDRFAAGDGPQDGMDAAAATEPDTEEAPQAAGDLVVRQAALLIEFEDGGLGVGSELSRRGPMGIGCLRGMAPLNAALALTALRDLDVELQVNGLARDLDLELLGDTCFVGGGRSIRGRHEARGNRGPRRSVRGWAAGGGPCGR